jgi:DNA-binding NtrC family response regulator
VHLDATEENRFRNGSNGFAHSRPGGPEAAPPSGYAPGLHVFLGMPAVIRSQAMQRVMGLVERVAGTNAAVLITGESGCGKELVARAIHHWSLRCGKPWVDISCAALPDHLVESELFGYERGAFSGAETAKPGLFEMAHGGTLFLDEVGELDPRMQVKLLRVLDGTPYYRLGGVRKVNVDVRIVTATNTDLEQAMKAGRFRRDLYHRLSQVPIAVPPLRERPEDIGPIAELFLSQQDSPLSFSPETLEALGRYAWPGNVRELRNVVLRAALMAQSPVIEPRDLPAGVRDGRVNGGRSGEALSLESVERQMILKVLAETRGHHQRAADLLGISRRTLNRKLKLYESQGISSRALA